MHKFSILFILFTFSAGSFSAHVVDPICLSCGAKNNDSQKLKSCSLCHVAKYCSVGCQKKDWANHKMQCSKVEKEAEAKVPDIRDQALAMVSKSLALKDQSKQFTFWKIDVDKIKTGCVEKFGFRLNSKSGSLFDYNDTILATALMDFELLHSLSQVISKLLHDKSVNAEKILNNIDDAYTIMSIRLYLNLSMPDNFFSLVAPQIAPCGFFIGKHNQFFNTFIANRGRSGQLNTISALVALEIFGFIEALENIYKGLAQKNAQKTADNTEAQREYIKTMEIGLLLDGKVLGYEVRDLSKLSEKDFMIVTSFCERHLQK